MGHLISMGANSSVSSHLYLMPTPPFQHAPQEPFGSTIGLLFEGWYSSRMVDLYAAV